YAAADIVVSRAGALSISELCLVGKPVIFVPSPNVAEDHQTKNALSLVKKNAAIMVSDQEAPEKLVDEAIRLFASEEERNDLGQQISKLAMPEATRNIVNEIMKLI